MQSSSSTTNEGSIVAHTKFVYPIPLQFTPRLVNENLMMYKNSSNSYVFYSLQTGLPVAQTIPFNVAYASNDTPIYCEENSVITTTSDSITNGELKYIDTSGQVYSLITLEEPSEVLKIGKYRDVFYITLTRVGIFVNSQLVIEGNDIIDYSIYSERGILALVHKNNSVSLYRDANYDKEDVNEVNFQKMQLEPSPRAQQVCIQNNDQFWIQYKSEIELYERKRSGNYSRSYTLPQGSKLHQIKSFPRHNLFVAIYSIRDGYEIFVYDPAHTDSTRIYRLPLQGITLVDFLIHEGDIYRSKPEAPIEFKLSALTHTGVFEIEWTSSTSTELIQKINKPDLSQSTQSTFSTLDNLLDDQLISVVNNALLEVESNEMHEQIYKLDNPLFILRWIDSKNESIWEQIRNTKNQLVEEGGIRCMDDTQRASIYNSLKDTNRKLLSLATVVEVLCERANRPQELNKLFKLIQHRATTLDVLATLLAIGVLPISRISYNSKDLQRETRLSAGGELKVVELLGDVDTISSFSFIHSLLPQNVSYPPVSIGELINLFEDTEFSLRRSHIIMFYFLVELHYKPKKNVMVENELKFSDYASKFRISEQWQKCVIGGWLCDDGKVQKGAEFLLQAGECLAALEITDQLISWFIYLGYYNFAKGIIRTAGLTSSSSHYLKFLAELGTCPTTLNLAFKHVRQWDRPDHNLLRILCEFCLSNRILRDFFALPFNQEESDFVQNYFHREKPEIEFQFLIVRGRTREAAQLKYHLQQAKMDPETSAVISKLASGVEKVTPAVKLKYPHLFRSKATDVLQQQKEQLNKKFTPSLLIESTSASETSTARSRALNSSTKAADNLSPKSSTKRSSTGLNGSSVTPLRPVAASRKSITPLQTSQYMEDSEEELVDDDFEIERDEDEDLKDPSQYMDDDDVASETFSSGDEDEKPRRNLFGSFNDDNDDDNVNEISSDDDE
jgi:hypothetical protein